MTPSEGPSGHTSASVGERMLQQQLGTADRARDFYDMQVHRYLTPAMRTFIARQSMVFLASADGLGACDASFRAGPPGFVVPLGGEGLTFPDYRGNGVMASAGNLVENPQVGLLFIDFTDEHIGLHVNGRARLVADAEQRARHPHLPLDTAPGRAPELWLNLMVDEAYVHCSRHIPHLEPAQRPRPSPGRPRDGDYFREEEVPRGPRRRAGRGRLRLLPSPSSKADA